LGLRFVCLAIHGSDAQIGAAADRFQALENCPRVNVLLQDLADIVEVAAVPPILASYDAIAAEFVE